MELYKVKVSSPFDFLVKESKPRLVMMSKARKMPIGTVATWSGVQYRKVSENQWEPVKGTAPGDSATGSGSYATKQKETAKEYAVGSVKTVKGKKYRKEKDGRWHPVK